MHMSVMVSWANENIIDCNKKPSCPEGWKILPSEKQLPFLFKGNLDWNPENQKDALYIHPRQTDEEDSITGVGLCKELSKSMIVALPANPLDFMLQNPRLIPIEWKPWAIVFWTIYLNGTGERVLRYLCNRNDQWCERDIPLDKAMKFYYFYRTATLFPYK